MPAHFGSTDLPLWQFVGLIFMFSILIGSPIFVCFVYHRRREQEHLQTEIRRAFTIAGTTKTNGGMTLRARHQYQVPGRDHYILPFPHDVTVPPTPRRSASGGSTVPLLTLSSEGGSRNVSGSYTFCQQTHTMSTDAVECERERSYARGLEGRHDVTREVSAASLGGDFAERSGTAAAVAYPEVVHRGPQRRDIGGVGAGGYGTLGHVMHSTYTAAQRAYRNVHRPRLNFWAAWMAPWFRMPARLAAIDEESVGTSRHSRGRNRRETNAGVNTNVDTAAAQRGVNVAVRRDGERGSTVTSTSGYSMNVSYDTPHAFDKVDGSAGYNPSMARSLTRRLLKVGFEAKDGVEDIVVAEEAKNKGLINVWKGCAELKKRAMERRKAEGSGQLFSIPRRKAAGALSDGSIEEEEEGRDGIGELEAARTSIRDFAHAFGKDIVGESATGTVRIHEIDDPADYSEDEDKGSAEVASGTMEASQSLSAKASMSGSVDGRAENKPTCSPTSTSTSTHYGMENDSTPVGTIRGRRTKRNSKSSPGTQKMRMERNTPKNTTSRVAFTYPMYLEVAPGGFTTMSNMESEID
ncbi:hypothetical protein TWF696_005749 [Orbilia brochopaga]|uniref:Uncharacterized protein n=1 Tax=Orbilia brochopaga TaxID=3140254 RepID=A0AAV9V0K5_9PEZI